MSIEYLSRATKPCGSVINYSCEATDDERKTRTFVYKCDELTKDNKKADTIAKAVMGLFRSPASPPTYLSNEDSFSLILVHFYFYQVVEGNERDSICMSLVLMDESCTLVFARAIGPAATLLEQSLGKCTDSHGLGSRVEVKRHKWYWKTVPYADGCMVGGVLLILECAWRDGPSQKEHDEINISCSRVDLNVAGVERAVDHHAIVFNALHNHYVKGKHGVMEPMTLPSLFQGLFLPDPSQRNEWMRDAKLNRICPVVSKACLYCSQRRGYLKCVYLLCPLDEVEEEMEDAFIFENAVKLASLERPGEASYKRAKCFDDLSQEAKIDFMLRWYRNVFWIEEKTGHGCPEWKHLMHEKYGEQRILPKPIRLPFSQA